MPDLKAIDLPVIAAKDKKLDTSEFDTLEAGQLEAVKARWVAPARSNEQLVGLVEMCPEKIARLTELIAHSRDEELNQLLREKIDRLKEQYAVVLHEIDARRTKAVALANEEPIEDITP